MGDAATVRVLALDPAMKNTGWAVGSTDGSRPTWGVHRSPSWGTAEGKQLVRFCDWLLNVIADYNVKHCYYEAVFIAASGGTEAIRSKIMIEGAILWTCERAGVIPWKVPLQSWRSRFIGATQAPPHYRAKQDAARQWLKAQSLSACANRGWLTDNDDEAEALGIMDFGLASLDMSYASRTDSIFRRTETARAREAMVR